jgi:hypothetical protein
VDTNDRLGGGPLQIRRGASVDRRAEEVVGRRVADVELDGWIQFRELDQVDAAKLTGFDGRLRR